MRHYHYRSDAHIRSGAFSNGKRHAVVATAPSQVPAGIALAQAWQDQELVIPRGDMPHAQLPLGAAIGRAQLDIRTDPEGDTGGGGSGTAIGGSD